ncbi:MAG: 50S ribosomal protein L21 [Bdellovibrionales bacterium RIFCSPHIGHO2_01_FULL_40_29]|nr:MAG: 50S ribosomal protein L21 [Bdellovibrionales bacterium RIFCSPHIGHO2_01_FULL_40_29]OFZ34900.1 MAG: 50S ribosomal protein L21 [Bdellovibrionales bacterium RIFCSPHIGHO2_02_FULL_40_15]
MYAIIKTGGKQYKVQAGDVLQIEKVDQALGSEFNISEILMVGGEKAHIGSPLVKNAKVTVVVTKQAKTRKVIVFKKKRRQGYRKFATHKQNFTEIFIKSITSPDGQTSKTDATPLVKDMAALRQERIQLKVEDRKARAEGEVGVTPVEKTAVKKAAPKKKAAKKVAKKATSKRAVKKSAKKAAKKTTKKTK